MLIPFLMFAVWSHKSWNDAEPFVVLIVHLQMSQPGCLIEHHGHYVE